ncbi:MAG: ABC-F family ATP-binding cassette domain-containing protein [Parvularculaceae bacterium]
MPPLLLLDGVRLTFGGEPLFENASLAVRPRDRIALVGRNGSGKTTLLKIAAGLVEPDGGERIVKPGVRISYLPQEPDLAGFETVGAYAAAGPPPTVDPHEAARMLNDFGLAANARCETLSGGEARRAAIARALAGDPDVLLLDEPTNHLDLPAIEMLENRLATGRAALVVISHDRRFLEVLSERTVWIDRGVTRAAPMGFSGFETWRDKFLEEEKTARHKRDRKIAAEEDWIRYGVTARRRRNMRRLRALKDLRNERRHSRRPPGAVQFSLNAGKISGKRAVVAENLTKSFSGRAVVRDFSIEIARGDRVGFVGPNGAGKTTLVSLLSGALAPDSGAIRLGTNLEIASLDQRRASLEPDMRVADAITDGRGDWVTIAGRKLHAATYLRDFLFAPEQWRAPVKALSGGERGRLALAATLAKPSNLLILDEPTNDLDLETLDLLEETIAGYPGTLLLVSHDRSFLDRIVTSVVAPDPDGRPGRWREYAGGYSDMLVQRGSTPQAFPAAPRSEKQEREKNLAVESKSNTGKLSYKEKYALEQLPGRIAALEAEVTKLKKKLADPEFYERDGKAFENAAAMLEKTEAALARAEDEWLALELKREGLQSQ